MYIYFKKHFNGFLFCFQRCTPFLIFLFLQHCTRKLSETLYMRKISVARQQHYYCILANTTHRWVTNTYVPYVYIFIYTRYVCACIYKHRFDTPLQIRLLCPILAQGEFEFSVIGSLLWTIWKMQILLVATGRMRNIHVCYSYQIFDYSTYSTKRILKFTYTNAILGFFKHRGMSMIIRFHEINTLLLRISLGQKFCKKLWLWLSTN